VNTYEYDYLLPLEDIWRFYKSLFNEEPWITQQNQRLNGNLHKRLVLDRLDACLKVFYKLQSEFDPILIKKYNFWLTPSTPDELREVEKKYQELINSKRWNSKDLTLSDITDKKFVTNSQFLGKRESSDTQNLLTVDKKLKKRAPKVGNKLTFFK
jgi:hypothetical protein